jgi:hypothetical protein
MRILMSMAVLGTLIVILVMGCHSSSDKGAPPTPLNKGSLNQMKAPPVPKPPPKK